MQNRKALLALGLAVLLAALLALPVHMGNGVNARLPIIGTAEKISEEYCEETLSKAAKAYVLTKVIDKTVSTLQRIEVSITPFGLGMSVAPGEMLAAVNDAIERVSTALFSVMGLMLVEKLLVGMISWVSFKLMLPLAVGLALLYCLSGRRFAWSRSAAVFLANTALICWLFFPVTALVGSYVEQAYLGEIYAEQMHEVDSSAGAIIGMDEVETDMPGVVDEDADSGWFSGTMEKLESILNTVKNALHSINIESLQAKAGEILNYADNATDRLFHVFCIFVLTTIVIPLFMFFLLYKMLYLLTKNFMESSPEAKRLVYSAAADVKRIGEGKKEEAASKE